MAENYDDRYRGRVTVREALIQSLNACAVRLPRPGRPRRLPHPAAARRPRHPGPAGRELRPAAGPGRRRGARCSTSPISTPRWPRKGVHRPARLLEDEARRGRRFPRRARRTARSRPRSAPFPRGGAGLTEILTDVRPARPAGAPGTSPADVPAVAWKTGTSYGHRDAWAVGFSARTTIGVWVGNFDGRPRKGISGSQHAGPLLFDLFRALEPGRRPGPVQRRQPAPGRDRGLRREPRAAGPVLPGPASPSPTCRAARSSPPARSTGGCWSTRRRASCWRATAWARRPHAFRLLALHPPELVGLVAVPGAAVEELPPLAAGCRGIPGRRAAPHRLARTRPPPTACAARRPGRVPAHPPGGPRPPPGSAGCSGTRTACWSPRRRPARQLFLTRSPGLHRLVVTDDLGRSDGVSYRVE